MIEDHKRLEEEASEITRAINSLADENSYDSIIARELKETLSKEKPPPKQDLEKVYAQVGLELPGIALQRFEAVEKFHESVIQNRRTFLKSEIDSAEARIASRRAKQDELDEGRKAELTMRRARLTSRLQQDLDERRETLSKAILTFEEISEELYESPGSLTIEATENGPEFSTVIQGKRSVGKNSMQIFCFDMTISILNVNGRMPGFLVHDSHLFDGADERQIGKALAIGAKKSTSYGFQYIVTMNTDDLPEPTELPKEFNLGSHINHVRLTDATESGGLFGFRFG